MLHRKNFSTGSKKQENQMFRKTKSYISFRWPSFSFRSRKPISKAHRFLLLVGFFVVFFNEFLIYEISRFSWPNLEPFLKKSTMQKILLIADPQLIGEKDEGLFGSITRIDADRYLSKSFSRVSNFIRPDWNLFLGDIFDEGLSATDDEFKRYFERFDEIFHFETGEQRSIVIPGDNDVGGEYYGDKQPILRQRFRNYFGKTIYLHRENDIEFLKLDIDMLETYVDGKRAAIMAETNNSPMTATFRLVLNHWPLITRSSRFIRPFIDEIEPNFILKGDSHHFYIISYNRKNFTTNLIVEEALTEPFFTFNLSSKDVIYEISVPTCSYRMGVERMGFAVLFLDSETKTAHLSILSTPRRYICLYLYAAYVIFLAVSLLILSIIPQRMFMRLLKIQ